MVKSHIKQFNEKLPKNSLMKKVMKNSSWLVFEKLYSMLLGLFVVAMIARYFGPVLFGDFNYALAFVSLFTALATLGLETLTIKSIVDKKYDEGTIVFTSFILRLGSGIFITIITSILIRVIEVDNQLIHILVFIMSFTITIKSFEVIEYWIQAYHRAKLSSAIRIIAYTFTSLLKISLVFMNGTIVHYSVIYFVEVLLVGIALALTYFKIREDKSPLQFNFTYAKNILSQSWYLVLSGLMITLYMRIDQVMLGVMSDENSEVGIYSAAVKIAEMWYFVPLAIITSYKPIIMNFKNNNLISYKNSINSLYRIVALMGLGFGIFIFFSSDLIVSILYGKDFSEASHILSISIWAGTFAVLGNARSIWLICEDLQRYTVVFMGVGSICNILLNAILIPKYSGTGAAVATLISQILVVIIVPLFFKKTRLSSKMMLSALSFKK
jgi:O-antigen/teichoic acid export membrane protein